MRNVFNTSLLLSAVLLTGCSSISTGIGGVSDYGCKAPPGVSCQSVSGVHANAIQHNLPSQRVGEEKAATAEEGQYKTSTPTSAPATVVGTALSSGMPIRAQTRVLRVWIAPWEDSEGDLNDQSYSYVVVDTGRWMIDHNRRNIANEYAPIRPPSGINGTNAKPAEKMNQPQTETGNE